MTETRRASGREVLADLTFVALATGLAQGAILWWRLTVGHTFIWQSRDHFWLAPIAYLLLFVLAALPVWVALTLVQRARPGLDRRRWSAAVFIALGVFSLLLLWPRLHWAAQLALALGIAVRGSESLSRVPLRVTARIALTLATLVVLLGAGHRTWRAYAERREMSHLPPAEDAPNVLLIILDTVRAASMSLHGFELATTPGLERLAGEGVVFDRAISASPWTLPSHTALFTGYDPESLAVNWRVPLDDSLPTLAELFTTRGYATAGFVANTYYAGHDSGLDRGFVHYEDYRTTFKQLLRSTTLVQVQLVQRLLGSRTWRQAWIALMRHQLSMPVMPVSHRKSGSLVTDSFLEWESRTPRRPFFAFLNYFDAHETYASPPGYDSLFKRPTRKESRYDGAIRFLDDEVGRVVDSLRAREVLEKTIVVVTSDHGEHLGEHQLWGHGNSLYMEALHVPLFVRFPARVPRGTRVGQAVATRDLGATLIDLSGGDGRSFPGRSLARWWGDSAHTAPPEPIASSFKNYDDAWLDRSGQRSMRSLVAGDWHWIQGMGGKEQLFDFRQDARENANVWDDATMRARFDSVRSVRSR